MSDAITLKTEEIINSYYKITGNNKALLGIDDYLKFRETAIKESSIRNDKENHEEVQKRPPQSEPKPDNSYIVNSNNQYVEDELEKPFVVNQRNDTKKVVAVPREQQAKGSRAVDILNSIED